MPTETLTLYCVQVDYWTHDTPCTTSLDVEAPTAAEACRTARKLAGIPATDLDHVQAWTVCHCR